MEYEGYTNYATFIVANAITQSSYYNHLFNLTEDVPTEMELKIAFKGLVQTEKELEEAFNEMILETSAGFRWEDINWVEIAEDFTGWD